MNKNFMHRLLVISQQHQWKVVGIVLILAFIIGFIGFVDAVSDENNIVEPFVRTSPSIFIYLSALLWAFLNMVIGHTDNLNNAWITVSQLLSYIAVTFAIFIALLKDLVAKRLLESMRETPHCLIIGLGENNRTFLESEIKLDERRNIIIIESDPVNIYIDHFRDKGFGVFVGKLDEYQVNFPMLDRVIISTGNDRINIEIAGKLMRRVPDGMTRDEFGYPTVVNIHLQNQNYKALFQQNILNIKDKNLPLEFKPYSFNDDAARQLFEKHTVLGNYQTLVQTKESYSVVIIGDGDLAERIIYHLCMQANLPNKNHLTIHCFSEDAKAFLVRIHAAFVGIKMLEPVINLVGYSCEIDRPEIYAHDVWKEQNITNVIICNDDENINLEYTVNLHDKVYLADAVYKTMKTKVHFAMFNTMGLSKSIDENKDEFEQFFTFGDAQAICSREYLIDEKYETIAKLIHFGYAREYNKNQILRVDDEQMKDKIDKTWHDTTIFTKRESNRSQALHINTKLMALGLKKIEKADVKLLEINQEMMQTARAHFPFTDAQIVDISKKLYSVNKDDEAALNKFFDEVMKSDDIYSKLARAEHERWNTFHYLNGWRYNQNRNDAVKHHNCLVHMEEFSDVRRRETIIYDLYATLYIPNYLASSGYKIVPIE